MNFFDIYQEMNNSLLAVTNSTVPETVSFAEFPAYDLLEARSGAAVIIKTSKSTIEISSDVSEKLMIKLVKAMAHAL